MPDNARRKHYVVVNHYVREDQYEWLRQHGNHSVLMRDLIDGAMYDPLTLAGARLAELHEVVRTLDRLLTELRTTSEPQAKERRAHAREQRRGAGWRDRSLEASEAK